MQYSSVGLFCGFITCIIFMEFSRAQLREPEREVAVSEPVLPHRSNAPPGFWCCTCRAISVVIAENAARADSTASVTDHDNFPVTENTSIFYSSKQSVVFTLQHEELRTGKDDLLGCLYIEKSFDKRKFNFACTRTRKHSCVPALNMHNSSYKYSSFIFMVGTHIMLYYM